MFIELNEKEINIVLDALADKSLREVYGVFNKIQEQANNAINEMLKKEQGKENDSDK